MAVRIRESIDRLPAYRPGKPAPADAFKLSSNENPFPPLQAVIDEITAAAASMNLYPIPDARPLREALSRLYQVDHERIVITHGSVMGLQQLISAVAGPGDEVVYAWRSFEAYPLLTQLAGATSVQVPLLPDSAHDLDAMIDAITENTKVVIVCSPNNPTSNIITQQQFDDFVARVPDHVLVLLDEAYIEFVQEPTVDGIAAQAEHQNVVVLRTFSKAYGLAGLRVGYSMGDPRILNAAFNTVAPFAVDNIAQRAALAALESAGEVFARVESIADQAADIFEELTSRGVQLPKPHGNFIWIAASGVDPERVQEVLARHGIVARAFPEGVRISIGDPKSKQRVIDAAEEISRLS
ncbi:histidinol-phosphate transaminase [Agrococcus casei]|uniref:Histidinol-phosphate aminotransferase n=1 Tax=Agrococcus casei LMG 22410 TaxID=1255656 RepID=A0A1R4ERG8_9MICO|nr:histidinol-phosphate transaminase [Agrococcus casei]SJM46258.1 Biosynthetic Aromatic amino acid aminotransferase beta [Agrococcus casei LMG 22410]